jgi:outer membrane protein assembly factor BamA
VNALQVKEPLIELYLDVQAAVVVYFEPDDNHQDLPQTPRRKGVFEGLMFEGRPPLNVGVTSSGDFFGGSQAVLSDVLEDHTFALTIQSLRDFRSYDFTYVDQSRRLHWGASVFDNTVFFYSSPYTFDAAFSRQGAIATRRSTGGIFSGSYPFSKFSRLELGAGVFRQHEQFESSLAEEQARQQAAALGLPFVFNNGTIAPLSLSLVGETTRFREYGPLSGNTYLLSAEVAPGIGGLLRRTTFQADLRHYARLFGDVVFATRVNAFRSRGQNPAIFYFGGNMDLRGYPYLSFTGNEGFHANAELRLPIIDLMKTPLGIFGPVRGTLYAGIGGAHYNGDNYKFGTSAAGVSYVNNILFGEPVTGFHLIDGRASYGFGLHAFLFGLPLHFDWSKLTDLKVSSPTQFDFWIGFDF